MNLFTKASGNKKTGKIPVSISDKNTCPDSCPFKYNGCYATTGVLNIHWKDITTKKRGIQYKEFLKQVEDLPKGTFWRHNQAGDLEGDNEKIDIKALKALVKANKGKRGYTYTHKPMTPKNKKAVKEANEEGFTINLSANNLKHADELKKLGIAPVVTVLPIDSPKTTFTPKGHKVIVCPAVYKEGITCSNCQLCQKQRSVIIGFPAHGRSKKKVSQIAEG